MCVVGDAVHAYLLVLHTGQGGVVGMFRNPLISSA